MTESWAGRDELRAEMRGLLASAEAFARHAGQITLKYFGKGVSVDWKGDGTPVTVADREAGASADEPTSPHAIPDHGILGEEFGETGAGARIRWIIDPIDGTKSFVHGVPLYGVLVGIEIDGVPSVGVAHFPALDETAVAGPRVWDAAGTASPPTSRTVTRLEEAIVLTTDDAALTSSRWGTGYEAVRQHAAFARTWGDAYGHILVATGRAEIMVDPELFPWDAAPLLPILEEAGGRFTALSGDADIFGGSGLSTNGALHDQVLRLLG